MSLTPEQIAEMRQQVAEYDAEQARKETECPEGFELVGWAWQFTHTNEISNTYRSKCVAEKMAPEGYDLFPVFRKVNGRPDGTC